MAVGIGRGGANLEKIHGTVHRKDGIGREGKGIGQDSDYVFISLGDAREKGGREGDSVPCTAECLSAEETETDVRYQVVPRSIDR
jgi:hypothetical protein